MTTSIEIYRFLVRKVHPDLNPNVFNATKKTQELNLVKGDIFSLINLGIKWGFFIKK